MAQYVNFPTSLSAMFGQNLGEGLGTGLSDVLDRLASEKALSVERSRLAPILEQLSGQKGLEYTDPSIQREVIKRKLLEPSEQAYAQAMGLGPTPTQEGGMGMASAGEGQQQIPRFTERQVTELKKMQQKELSERYKAADPFEAEVIKNYESARDNLFRFKRMKQLSDTDNLDSPYYLATLKYLGLDNIDALKDETTSEYQKLYADFLGGAKDAFGGRVTNFEIEQFMKRLPSLMMSKEGRERVFKVLGTLEKARMAKYDAYKDIVDQYGGVPPRGVRLKATEVADKRISKLYNKFLKEAELSDLVDNPGESNQPASYAMDQLVEKLPDPTTVSPSMKFEKDGYIYFIDPDTKKWQRRKP